METRHCRSARVHYAEEMIRGLSLVVPLALTGCFNLAGDCEDTIVSRLSNPSATKQAVLFERSCGATTGFSTQISIIPVGEDLQDTGNVFVADGGTAATAWGGPWAEVRWLSPHHLLVRYDQDARVFKAAARADDTEVRYEKAVPSAG